jgi:hypothetical protein
MAANFTCSRSLRVLGQTLETMGVDSFEIRCNADHFYLQCGDPAPPHLAITDFSYSPANIRSLDSEARKKRQESFKFVDFNGLAEILRTVGRHIESKDGRLLRVCNCEELLTTTISDYAMRMYKDRARIQQEHAHK